MASSAAPNKKIEKKYWTKEQDQILVKYFTWNEVGKWNQVSKNTGLCEAGKTGNSCRLRWVNHLNPKITTRPFWPEEDDIIIYARNIIYGGSNKWCKIAEILPGRKDNQVKNRWHKLKLWERPTPNKESFLESIINLYKRLFPQVDHEPMISNDEIDQDLLDDEPDVNQQPFEESINDTGGLSRVNVDQESIFKYINAPGFDQFSPSDWELLRNFLN